MRAAKGPYTPCHYPLQTHAAPPFCEYVIVGDLKIKVSAYFEGLSQAHYAMVICFQYAFLFFQEETSASGSGQSE